MRLAKTWMLTCWLLLVGCRETLPPAGHEPAQGSTAFDVTTTGTIHGQVRWEGEVPQVPPFQVHAHFLSPNSTPKPMQCANPHAPKINPKQGGVANAVVFLRGVNPARARFWSHPPVRLELGEYRLDVVQGASRGPIGFVRRGDGVEMVATRPIFHNLQAKGAAFFSLPFVEPGQITRRTLEKKGLVELSSGAGYYWLRGYLFVDDHPYYTCTDTEGRFALDQVPVGAYTLVCWLPSWHITRQERNPESSLVSRVVFSPPVELDKTVALKTGERRQVDFALSASDFEDSTK